MAPAGEASEIAPPLSFCYDFLVDGGCRQAGRRRLGAPAETSWSLQWRSGSSMRGESSISNSDLKPAIGQQQLGCNVRRRLDSDGGQPRPGAGRDAPMSAARPKAGAASAAASATTQVRALTRDCGAFKEELRRECKKRERLAVRPAVANHPPPAKGFGWTPERRRPELSGPDYRPACRSMLRSRRLRQRRHRPGRSSCSMSTREYGGHA